MTLSTLFKRIFFFFPLGGFEEFGFGAALAQSQDELTLPGRGAFFILITLVMGAEDRNPPVFTRYHPAGDLICALIRASHAFCLGVMDLGSWLSHQGNGLKSVGWETAAFSLLNFPLSTLDRLCRCVLQLWNGLERYPCCERCWWDAGGRWGRAEGVSRPCSFLPIPPCWLFLHPPLPCRGSRSVLFASRGLLSLNLVKSVFPKHI